MSADKPIFGRRADLELLLGRVERSGLTVVAGLPKQGKTRLLEELRDTLDDPDYQTADGRGFLVGWDEAVEETPNTLRRALHELYLRWLSHAPYRQQAKRVWQQQKDRLAAGFPDMAENLGGLFSDLDPSGLTKGIHRLLSGLAQANRDLKGESEGFDPPLSYDQTRDLLQCLFEISDKNAVLILDAFERSGCIERDADNLHRFLDRHDEWPPCHILIAVREPPAEDDPRELGGYRAAERLVGSHRRAHMHTLGPMDLNDPAEGREVFQHIGRHIDNRDAWYNSLGPHEVLTIINGHPGTLADVVDARPRSEQEFRRVAAEARGTQHAALRSTLEALRQADRALLKIAIRLALLPEMRPDSWEALRPLVIDKDVPPDALPDLEARKVLQQQAPPSFGHTTRYEAARRFATTVDSLRAYARPEIEHLVLGCAARLNRTDPELLPFGESLVVLGLSAGQLGVHPAYIGLSGAAFSLLLPQLSPAWPESLPAAASLAREEPSVAPLVGMGLFHAFHDAEGDEATALLNELRTLEKAHPEDAAVRQPLAMGLVNALHDAEGDEATALLEELRTLEKAHPEDAALRQPLAMGLFNAFHNAEGDEATALLDELRTLEKAHPEDAAVRQRLARGLFNAFKNAEGDEATALLDELRALEKAHPEDAAVRQPLAMGLVNALQDAEGDEATALLDELRALQKAHPEDAAVRQPLAIGLFNAFINAEGEEASALRDELRSLHQAHPDDDAVARILKVIEGAPSKAG